MAEGPGHFRPGQLLGRHLLQIPHWLFQLHFHLGRAGQAQGLVLAKGKAVALQHGPLPPGKQGLDRPFFQLLDAVLIGVHRVEPHQPGGRGFHGTHRLIHHVFPLLIRCERLGAGRDRHRLFHPVVNRELHHAGSGHRGRWVKADQVQKFGEQFVRHPVHPLYRLVEHGTKQLGQGGARVVFAALKPPFRRIGAGQLLHFLPQLFHTAAIQYRRVHRAPPPSDPSVM